MSTQPTLSPLEQLGQDVGQQSAPAKTDNQSLSPLEQLGQDVRKQPATPSKNFDVAAALGGMHGGSYDIAFRDPKGQISPDTIKAEAVGGSVGDAVGGLALAAPEVVPKIVEKAKAVYDWASANPIKSLAISQIANELGVHPFDLMHSVVKYGKNLFGESQ